MPHSTDPTSLSPKVALARLVDGNRRFRERGGADAPAFCPVLSEQPQRPFAVVLGCSDARTPVELLFDEGLGALFVVRIAGNIVAPSVVGSIEFAVSQFGTRLIVVLGHTRCGAVKATTHALVTGNGSESRNIRSITDRIAPHIEADVRASAEPESPEENFLREARTRLQRHAAALASPEFLRQMMRINVRASADHLRHGSRLIEDLVLSGRVVVLGAEYELETGGVNFFDGEISDT